MPLSALACFCCSCFCYDYCQLTLLLVCVVAAAVREFELFAAAADAAGSLAASDSMTTRSEQGIDADSNSVTFFANRTVVRSNPFARIFFPLLLFPALPRHSSRQRNSVSRPIARNPWRTCSRINAPCCSECKIPGGLRVTFLFFFFSFFFISFSFLFHFFFFFQDI
jgi:hypothetical protein